MAIQCEKCMGHLTIGIYGGTHPWLREKTYVVIDGPAGPSMAAKFAVDGPTRPVVG